MKDATGRTALQSAEALGAWAFSGGWAFFLPYALLYLLGLALNVRAGTLRAAFWLCHVTLLTLFLPYALRRFRACYPSLRGMLADPGSWFWILLFLGFLLPGVYLEYPSDAWDHFARINSWRADAPIQTASVVWRWAYFFGWSVLSFAEPIHQRTALALLAAFWQLLVAFQLARLARRLGFSSAWSRVVVFGAVALFGNNLFSFFRSYALSSTPLAYVAFLRAAIAVLDLNEDPEKGRSWLVLFATVAIMAFNHEEEILLLATFAAAVVFARCFRHERGKGFGTLAVALCLLAISLGLGWLVLSRAATFGLRPPTDLYPFMSRFGSFRVWDPALSYFQAMGLHGLVSCGIALLMWRKERRLAALTLAPVFLLLFPPFAYAFAHATSVRNTYRLLYVLPDSFMLAAAARAIRARWLAAWGGEAQDRVRLLVGGAFFLAIGLVPGSPFFGKLPFQYHFPSGLLSLAPLDGTAQWFRGHRHLPDECSITSDSVTETVLTAFRGTAGPVLRTTGLRWLQGGRVSEWKVAGTDDLLEYRLEHRVCGFLVFAPKVFHATFRDEWPHSWVGSLSGHWSPDAANLMASQVVGLKAAAEGLPGRGWRKTFVPPFYWYYEPPELPDSP